MASAEDDTQLSLPEQYDFIFNLHQELETTDESTASDKIQGKLRKGIKLTESAIEKVNDLELFSRNEDIDEVSTNEVRFMMLSAYLGYFTCLNTHLPRREALTKCKLCYRDFIRLCNSYSVTSIRLKEEDDDGEQEKNAQQKAVVPRTKVDSINSMAGQRESKIQRFKEKKQLESRLSELKALVERDHVDDEVKRDFYMVQLKRWANTAVDELDSCDLEVQMLAHRQALQKNSKGADSNPKTQHNSNSKAVKPFRPFILTKNQLQKHVIGAGYPSLPSMTVDEFYEQKLKEGTLSESVQGGHSMQKWAQDPEADEKAQEEEAAEKEKLEEEEDEEALQRARDMDDWKDDHRRGDGNRHNKG